VVFVSGGENTDSTIAGLTIIGGSHGGGIYCDGVSPAISNCFITGARGSGIGAWSLSCPVITNCCIIGNKGWGILLKSGGVEYAGTIKNCTIAANGDGIFGVSVITNSIIWENSSTQIAEPNCVVTYSNIQGGFPGEGNIDVDPCFADTNSGDYHLKSQAGRWDPVSESWVIDSITSLCIDAGDPANPFGFESVPNGGRINMGAYGGTSEASMSLLAEVNQAE
jgi:hypothetical protein